MVKIKEMPSSKKYAMLLDTMKHYDTTISFIRQHKGEQAVVELQNIWQEGVKPIPEDASIEDKYEIAYGNWIWMGKNNFSVVRKHLGEDGIEQYKRERVDALKQENAGPAMAMLSLIRAISPGYAFTMTAKQMAYQMQWISPFSLSELNRSRSVIDIQNCKILDYPDIEDICLIGCQKMYPMWFAEQFKIDAKFEREGNDCTCTITPVR